VIVAPSKTGARSTLVLPAHALRHSHASALIAAGWDIAEVSARLGHSSIATTQRIYVHQFDAPRRSEGRRNRLAALEITAHPPAHGRSDARVFSLG
jgi:integrase